MAKGNPLVTQVDQASAVSANTADGSAAAQLTSVTMADGGQLMAQFSSGKSVAIGQLSRSPIFPTRNSHAGYRAVTTSRPARKLPRQLSVRRVPVAEEQVVGAALEQSTVDIAAEFSNLITLQNAYQANSRVITTENQILQQTVSLVQA